MTDSERKNPAENKYRGRGETHPGTARSAPYPVSRLAPGIDLVDAAREIAQADAMISGRVDAKLQVIAEQIRHLQAQARAILEEARSDHALHRARCQFQRIPGHTYHLYRDRDGSPYFSMLSPADWRGQPPHPYLGAYRLEADLSWTAVDADTGTEPAADGHHDDRRLLDRLLDEPD